MVLIFTMAFPMQIRCLYIEKGPCWCNVCGCRWAGTRKTAPRLKWPAASRTLDVLPRWDWDGLINLLALRKCSSNLKSRIFKLIIQNSSLGSHCEIALRWMPQNLPNEKSALVQVMAWCHQAASHYLSQCWLRSISPYGVTKPQWVNTLRLRQNGQQNNSALDKCHHRSICEVCSVTKALLQIDGLLQERHNSSALDEIWSSGLVFF